MAPGVDPGWHWWSGTLLSEQQRSLDAGMNEVMTKPFDPQTMVGEVRLLVGQARAHGLARPS